MFIRKKKVKNNNYAYLIKNKYNKRIKQSRQNKSKYLGKIIDLGNSKEKVQADTIKNSIITTLTDLGFSHSGNKLVKEKISINLDAKTVLINSKQACLKINEGYLCDHTLNTLLNFKIPSDLDKNTAQKLAEAFICAGIDIEESSFISLFTKRPN